MPIRRHLLLLTFSLLLPAVIACGVAILLTYSTERQRTESNLLRTTQVLAESLDRQLDVMVARLEGLATSPALSEGDLPGFWDQGRRAVTLEGMWLVLTDRDGQQQVNTLRPFGEPLPRHPPGQPSNRFLTQVLETGRPVVSDLFLGPVSGKPTLAVSVPVYTGGAISHVLSMGILPEAMTGAISSISLPPQWLVAAFDRNLAIVARSKDGARHVGTQATPALAQAMRISESGIIDAVSKDGIPTRVAFSRSPRYGWSFAVGVPTSEIAVAVTRTVLIFVLVAATLLALGAAAALIIGRRISAAIGGLVPAAAGLSGGLVPLHRPTGVAEADDVSLALEKTGHDLKSIDAERARAEYSLVSAKQRAEDILSSITDGFYALDGEWRFTYLNAQARRILDKSSADVLGKGFLDVFPQVRGTAVHETYAEVMATRLPKHLDFVSPILKRWTAFSVYPAGDGGISVYFRDISAQKAGEEALIAAKEEAEQANRAKSQFLASASHDLRQPVQSLFFFHEVLAGKLRGDPAAEVVDRMQVALNAMKTLLDGLLDISRLHAGTIEVEPTAFPISRLLIRVQAEDLPRAEAAGLTLRIVHSTAWVRSDSAQLERMLRNLVDNSMKYTPPGGTILVGCRRTKGELLIQVVDTGPGIAEDKQLAVFEEFVQLGNPERDRAKGLGLGLAIVRHLGRLLGHRVTLRSRPGHGTCFSVAVPLAPPRREKPPALVPLDQLEAGGLALVVDDETLILAALRTMLESWGWHVLAAESGKEATRLVSGLGRPPDVILADYRLRDGETGLQAIGDVVALCGLAIPAAVLTGDTSPDRIAECSSSGFPLLHKPVEAAALRDLLERMRSQSPLAIRHAKLGS